MDKPDEEVVQQQAILAKLVMNNPAAFPEQRLLAILPFMRSGLDLLEHYAELGEVLGCAQWMENMAELFVSLARNTRISQRAIDMRVSNEGWLREKPCF